MEFSVVNILVLIAFGLLVAVTGGVAYLTIAEWGDRRQREQEKRREKGKGKR